MSTVTEHLAKKGRFLKGGNVQVQHGCSANKATRKGKWHSAKSLTKYRLKRDKARCAATLSRMRNA